MLNRVLHLIADIINDLHDIILAFFASTGNDVTDKALHFWMIGVIGIFLYVSTTYLFKWLAKYSIKPVSFIYTFTVLVVIVLALEVIQKITGRGYMDFDDITAGLWGFIFLFITYEAVVWFYKILFSKKHR